MDNEQLQRAIEGITKHVPTSVVPEQSRAHFAERLIDRGSISAEGRLIGESWIAELTPLLIAAPTPPVEPQKAFPGPTVPSPRTAPTYNQRLVEYLGRHDRQRRAGEQHLEVRVATIAETVAAKAGANQEQRDDRSSFAQRLGAWLTRKGR